MVVICVSDSTNARCRDGDADKEAQQLFHTIDAMGDGNGDVERGEVV